jgi:hypothetical protein
MRTENGIFIFYLQNMLTLFIKEEVLEDFFFQFSIKDKLWVATEVINGVVVTSGEETKEDGVVIKVVGVVIKEVGVATKEDMGHLPIKEDGVVTKVDGEVIKEEIKEVGEVKAIMDLLPIKEVGVAIIKEDGTMAGDD